MSTSGKRKRPTAVGPGAATASKACEECCRRKSKCDLRQPVCSRCAARNQTCVYSERRKPGPAKGCAVRSNTVRLQENENHLERLLFQYEQDRQSKVNTNANSANSRLAYNNTDAIQNYPATPKSSAQPLIDDNVDWEQILGPGGPKENRQSSTLPQPGESPLSQGNRISSAHSSLPLRFPGLQLRESLIKLYLSRVQQFFPVFPTFRSEKILAFLGHDDEHSILLDAICAISARYFEDLSLLGADKQSHAGDFFANRAKAMHVSRINAPNFSSLDLDTIKTSLLLAIYDVTRYPGLKSSPSICETVRLAYEFELDKLDCDDPNVHGSLSPEDREDGRYVWWSIWKIDVFYGCMSSVPFGIEAPKIQTDLPSGSLEEFVANGRATTRAHRAFPTDLSRAWKHALGVEIADCQELYLITNGFIREAGTLRRLQLSHQDVNQSLFLLENALSSFRIALPEVLQGEPVPAPGQNESLSSQRIKAETLLLYHQFVPLGIDLRFDATLLTLYDSTCILLYLPNRNDVQNSSLNYPVGISAASPPEKASQPFRGQWSKCLRSACAVRDILRELPPALISSISPTASAGLWYSGLILTLQAVTTEDGNEKKQMCSEVDIILAVLGRMAKYWDIAGAFYEALETLMSSSMHVRTSTDIRHLLKEWNGPYVGNQAVAPDSSLTIVPPALNGIEEIGPQDSIDVQASLDQDIPNEEFVSEQSNGAGGFILGSELDWLQDDVVMCLDAFCYSLQ